ncbi:MAG: hypothetical protein AAGA92_06525 [Planctomycetota bacterium]
MRAIALCTATLFLSLLGDDKPTLDRLLEERIKLNREYKEDFLEAAKESAFPEQAARFEAGVADGWIDLLTKIRGSDDEELKMSILRLEYYDEMRSYLTELEWAETNEERAEARAGIEEYEQRLKGLEN